MTDPARSANSSVARHAFTKRRSSAYCRRLHRTSWTVADSCAPRSCLPGSRHRRRWTGDQRRASGAVVAAATVPRLASIWAATPADDAEAMNKSGASSQPTRDRRPFRIRNGSPPGEYRRTFGQFGVPVASAINARWKAVTAPAPRSRRRPFRRRRPCWRGWIGRRAGTGAVQQ